MREWGSELSYSANPEGPITRYGKLFAHAGDERDGVGRVGLWLSRWLMLSAGLVVFALAYTAFYEFVRPRLAQLKWDISDDEDDEDDDFLFYAMITAIIVTTVIVIGGLVISVLIMIGA